MQHKLIPLGFQNYKNFRFFKVMLGIHTFNIQTLRQPVGEIHFTVF